MARLRPSANAEASPALALLDDFASLWQRLTPAQRKGLLHIMFAGAYFDGTQLVKVVANAPFDKLLKLPDRDGVG